MIFTKYKPDLANNSGIFITYGKEVGLVNLDPDRSFFRGKSGKIYYTSDEVLYFFNPNEVSENPQKPKVVFTDLPDRRVVITKRREHFGLRG